MTGPWALISQEGDSVGAARRVPRAELRRVAAVRTFSRAKGHCYYRGGALSGVWRRKRRHVHGRYGRAVGHVGLALRALCPAKLRKAGERKPCNRRRPGRSRLLPRRSSLQEVLEGPARRKMSRSSLAGGP